MKTIREVIGHYTRIRTDKEFNDIAKAMKEYAREVAKQTHRNCAENVKMKLRENWIDLHENDESFEIDKQSILSETNIPKLD